MNRKDSKRKSRQEWPSPLPSNVGVGSTGKMRKRQSRRRMTCPSAAEINKVMASMNEGQLTKGCSLEELLEKCIQSFDQDGNLFRSDRMVNMILTMHSWVIPSSEFANRLLKLYQETSRVNQCQRHFQICHFVRYWIDHYPEEFKTDSKLQEVMADLWEVVKREGEDSHTKLIDTSDVTQQDLTHTPNFNKKRKVSLLFDHLEPSELASHLSYLEFKSFCKLSHSDYRSYVQQNSVRESPGIEHAVGLCNSISQWVQVMILNRPTPQQRAEVFTKFIHVTQKLRQLQNFNTLMAVIGGLCHGAISRLKATHDHLPHEVIKTLNEITELLSSSSNYSTYRRIFKECEGFKIPVLGVHLKDLISLNEALPNFLEDKKINLSKLQSLYQHILELKQLKQASLTFEANKDVLHLLTLSLDLFYTEDEIYELSYAREPKTTKTLLSAPCKPSPEVVEWVAKPDPVTIRQHIQETVASLFETYDPEQSGYISVEDFEKIAANFPLSFQGLQKNRKGPVSREEIMAYFMKASSRLDLSFPETSKKLIFCNYRSSSPLWDEAKQGYRSQACEINYQKAYKGQLMAEFKKKFKVCQSLTPGSLTPNSITSTALKHTSSGSEDEAFTFSHSPSSSHESGQKERTVVTMGGSVQKSSICTRPMRIMHKETQTEGFSALETNPFMHKSNSSDTPISIQNLQQEQSRLCKTTSLETSPSKDHLEELKELEKERDHLLLENASLHCSTLELELENARLQGQIRSLQEELALLKGQLQAHTQPTDTFIVEDIDSLHLQCDSKT